MQYSIVQIKQPVGNCIPILVHLCNNVTKILNINVWKFAKCNCN